MISFRIMDGDRLSMLKLQEDNKEVKIWNGLNEQIVVEMYMNDKCRTVRVFTCLNEFITAVFTMEPPNADSPRNPNPQS